MWHQYPEGYSLNLSTRITDRRRIDAAKNGALQAPAAASGALRSYPSTPNPSASVLETCHGTIDYLTSARYVFGTTRFQKEAQEDPQHALPFRAGREGPSILTGRLKICHEESTKLKRRLSPAVALREPLGLCIRTRVPRELPPSSCPRLSPPGSRHPRPPVLLLAGP